MRCKLFWDCFLVYLLVLIVALIIVYPFLFLVVNSEPIIHFLRVLADYDVNTIVMGLLTIVIAIFVFCVELRNNYKRKVENQILLVDSLLAELDTLSSGKSEVYGGESVKGNMLWYQEQLLSKNEQSLDHEINHISYDSYITKLDKNILTKVDFKKFVRTLSYINDKIAQINHSIKILQSASLSNLKDELSSGVVNSRDKFERFLKKVVEYGFLDDLKSLIIALLEADLKRKQSRIFSKTAVDLDFSTTKISVSSDKKISIEEKTASSDSRQKLLSIVAESIKKVDALKEVLNNQRTNLSEN